MLQELLIAVRTLAKRPGYSSSVILTLALGIGASAMMFSLADAALLRPLPFRQPEGLVMLTGVAGPQRAPRGASFPEIADWRAMNATLEHLSIYDEISLNLRVGSEAVRVEAEMVSASYFPLLGIAAVRGRTFLEEEDSIPDRHAVTVVSNRFWRERLASDPGVLQRTIHLNDRPFQIVGVMPEHFAGVSFDTDVWVPSMMVSLTTRTPGITENRGNRWLFAIGRVKGGVTVARAQEDLSRVAGLLEQDHPETNRERGVDVEALSDALLGGTRAQVRALFGAVLLFLAISCANAAALQLVRTASRRRELAVRLALGARHWHILRQLLTESFLLSLAAGVLGALGAAWSTSAAVAFLPDGALPRHVQPAVDPRTLAFTLGVSLVVAVVVALFPAISAARGDLADVMKQGGRTLDTGLGSIRRPSTQQLLVATEIAAAMILLTVAGLVVRSLERQTAVSLGLDPRGVTIARLTLPASRYSPEQRIVFVERLEAELRRLPSVRAVAIASDLPMTGNASASSLLPDLAATPESTLRYYRHHITPEFFAVLSIPLVAGRTFTWQDRRGAPLVAIINDAAAQRVWGGRNVLGRRFQMGGAQGAQVEIVGVAGTARFRDLTTDLAAANIEPDVYFPFAQQADMDLEIALKTSDDVPVPAASLQQAVSAIEAGLPVYQTQRLQDAVAQQTAAARFVSGLLTIFSAGALLLAAIGLYGLIAYVVGLSRREIAIRLALGADRKHVAGLIVRNGMLIVAIGIIVGSAGALAAGRAIRSQLFQTEIADPKTFVTVALLMVAVTLLASLLPTRGAVRIDPQSGLRGE